jgi:hypothetical protein
MKMTNVAAAALLAGVVCGGCAKDEKKSDTTMKTTTSTKTTTPSPVTASPTTNPSVTATTATPAAPAAAVPEKDMTHVLTKDEAYYAASPAQATKPDGTLKAGTKVVLLMPRGSYAQVMTGDGKRVYTSTAALKPVGS